MFKYLALNFFRVVYSFRFEFLGKRCRLVGPLLLAGAQRIRIQNEVRLEMFASLSTASGGHINIGERTEIGAFARIDADSGHIQIGNDSSVNAFCNLNGYGGLLIGRNVRIASHAVILSSTHSFGDFTKPISKQEIAPLATRIDDDVWVGAHCVILGGVHIGARSVIGAGAVVVRNIPPNSIAAGVPARVVRTRQALDA